MLKKLFNLSGIFLIFALIIIFLGYLLIDNNLFSFKDKLYSKFPNIELRKYVFNKKSKMENFNNDYNEKFLPYTQFEKLNYIKKKIKFEKNLISQNNNLDKSIAYKRYNSFFIDLFEDKLILTDHLGNVYFIDQFELFSKKKEQLFAKNIKSNLKATRVFDAYVYKQKIFISYTLNNDNCNSINVSYANINFENLKFEKFYNPKTCNDTGSPGRIHFFSKNEEPGLLLSTSEGSHDKPGKLTQDKNSIFGKILFLQLKDGKAQIISLGHRVIQGLYADQNKIIATEHGPKGGDEINLIFDEKNYGWPVVSLGERYDFKYGKEILSYKKDHKKNNFKEPVFSFIPSIGISEIIKLPKTFSAYYDKHFLLSSLNGRSIYLIRFSDNFEKIITIEKVFINNRIRDLKFVSKNNSIILALEENGEIGILSKN